MKKGRIATDFTVTHFSALIALNFAVSGCVLPVLVYLVFAVFQLPGRGPCHARGWQVRLATVPPSAEQSLWASGLSPQE